MAQKIFDPAGERREACRIAVEKLREQHGGDSGVMRATGGKLKQQALSGFMKRGKLGIQLADAIAAQFETTVDGLVWLLLKEGGGEVRASSIPGWDRAVEEARAEFGDSRYDMAAQSVLPTAPRYATARFAYDLAQIFHLHVRVSSIMPAVRKIGASRG
jgi:hypothetical protein